MTENRRILVTGSEGFIGRHVVKALLHHDLVLCDIHTKELTGPFDGIIHLAAVSRVRDAEADRIKCLETNILLTARMIEWNPRWFIFASTCEPPTNVYGFSKRVAEDYIKMVCRNYVIFRLANVYGPGMAEDKLIPSVRNGAEPHERVFPFEHIHVDTVAEMIRLAVGRFDEPHFKPYTMKLATGVARTKAQLVNVATSY